MRAKKEEIKVTEEQIQVAYALNLCSVSVSQIVDYNDLYILEQEYENILNNLNLQNIPKDEALLDILKRLLETITFFRIQEGDKAIIDKEYQHKMKNAIWSAMPNPGALVSAGLSGLKPGNILKGGDVAGLAFSVAATVGTAYMNYRKTKADANLNHEKQLWELRRTAIEQLNNIRQQLFETSWRLADTYDFPDALRLTEKQIKEYNAILMDPDEVRKYERLEYIKDRFLAYPPFWYYFGNTANSIANSDKYGLSESNREAYRNKARAHFKYYSDLNKYNLLRVDNISSACSLEYVDLLDPIKDKPEILRLVNSACEHCGDSLDILQLCAVSYLRIGAIEEATRVLRKLVNEQYNAISNAQLLSTIYVNDYVQKNNSDAKADYMLLATRVNKDYLFPMPTKAERDIEELQKEHIGSLKKILISKYALVLKDYIKRYEKAINKIVPLPSYYQGVNIDEDIYSQTQLAREERIYQVNNALADRDMSSMYKAEIANISYSARLLEIMNSFFESLTSLDFVRGENSRIELSNIIKFNIHAKRAFINEADLKLKDISEESYRYIQENASLQAFTGDFTDNVINKVKDMVSKMDSLSVFTIAEMNLISFCRKNDIPEPEYMYETRYDYSEDVFEHMYFTRSLLLDTIQIDSDRISNNQKMMEEIRSNILAGEIILDKSLEDMFTRDDSKINAYFYEANINNDDIKAKTLAVINDKSILDSDLLLTTEGIIPVIRGVIKNIIAYKDVKMVTEDNQSGIKLSVNYFNDAINMNAFFDLCQKLKEYAECKN